AKSSAAEIQSHLYVALDRGYFDETTFKRKFELAEIVAKQLSGLISFLTGHKTRRTSSPSQPR
ncbi:MAG: four helix bundle protein, partial [Acidimicrobiia bacterium]